jgi:hypothetical protein
MRNAVPESSGTESSTAAELTGRSLTWPRAKIAAASISAAQTPLARCQRISSGVVRNGASVVTVGPSACARPAASSAVPNWVVKAASGTAGASAGR